MKETLKRLAKRSRWAVIARHALSRGGGRSAQIDAHGQSRRGSAADAVDYAASAFAAIVRHARLEPSELRGKRVLELGPGDNLGLALRFIAAGVEQVVTLDRFEVGRDSKRERLIYEELLSRLPNDEQARAAAALEPETTLLRPISGIGVEGALDVLEAESFDLIVSVAVLEHVDDPDASFAAMDRLLKPGGLMLHQVDLRDHTMFSGGGQHPLTFLTIGPRVWRAMISGWGGPNRHLIDYYRAKVHELGYEARLLVNDVLGGEPDEAPPDALAEGVEVSEAQRRLIAEIRPRLQPAYRDLPDADLVPGGIFMVARKP